MWRALVLLLLACGQPEDLLIIEGRVVSSDGGDATGVPLLLSRDLGSTENGCTTFSQWRELTAGDGGVVRIEHLRSEAQGRFGLPRCLRLSWADGERTNNLSWFARPRDTLLPDFPVPFDDVTAAPQLPAGGGTVTPVLPSYELRDDRGVFWRQTYDANSTLQLDGVGAQPAHHSTIVNRLIQRGQQKQKDELGQEPLLQFEYRQQVVFVGIDGNVGLSELGHGSPCNVAVLDSTACPLTDGLFEPVPTGSSRELIIELPRRPAVRTVVVRGIGTADPFTTLVVQGAVDGGTDWKPAARVDVNWSQVLLTTSSFEDPQPELFIVAHWSGPFGPVSAVRVSVEDAMGVELPVAWVSEVSIY